MCPSQNPDDVAPVEISSTSNGGIKIVTYSTWYVYCIVIFYVSTHRISIIWQKSIMLN